MANIRGNYRIFLLAILLIGLSLRLYPTMRYEQIFGYDSYYYMGIAKFFNSFGYSVYYPLSDTTITQSPLVYLIPSVLAGVFDAEMAMRYLPIFTWLLTVIVIYLFVGNWIGKWEGVASVGVFAFLPLTILKSLEWRGEILFALLSLISIYSFLVLLGMIKGNKDSNTFLLLISLVLSYFAWKGMPILLVVFSLLLIYKIYLWAEATDREMIKVLTFFITAIGIFIYFNMPYSDYLFSAEGVQELEFMISPLNVLLLLLYAFGSIHLWTTRRNLFYPLFLWGFAYIFTFTTTKMLYQFAMPASIMAGVFFVDSFKELKTNLSRGVIAGAISITIIIIGVYISYIAEPQLNGSYLEGLEILGEQPRGRVLTWWDEGSWVQGITLYPTYTDTVHGHAASRIKATEKAFLSTDNELVREFLTREKISYILVSSDILYKLRGNYSFMRLENIEDNAGYWLYHFPPIDVYIDKSNPKIAMSYFNTQDNYVLIKNTYLEGLNGSWSATTLPFEQIPKGGGYNLNSLYVPMHTNFNELGKVVVYDMNTIPSFVMSLLFLSGWEYPVEQIYGNSEIKLYKVIYEA